MKKYLFLILFVIVLVLPAVLQRVVGAAASEGESGPGVVTLDVVTPHNQDIRNVFGPGFSEWHKAKYGSAVNVRFTAPGGTGDISRLLTANYTSALQPDGSVGVDFKPPYDVVWGGGDFFFDIEIKKFLAPTSLSEDFLKAAFPEPSLAGVRLYDYNGPGKPVKWVGICISAFGIIYNPDVYAGLGIPAPESWPDLTRPDLQGWLALANPQSSSSAAVAYSMVYQRAMADEEEAFLKTHPDLVKASTAERMKNADYKAAVARGWHTGMGRLMLIAANARYFTDSGTQPSWDVANGDAAVAMTIDFYARTYEGAAGEKRARLVTPRGATAINPDPAAVLLGVKGEKYTVANQFLEYLLSPEAQQKWILKPGTAGAPDRALYRPPVRKDAYTDTANWTHPRLNPFSDALGFNQRGEWNALFSETRSLVWAASWIDTRVQLKDTYKSILAVENESKRAALLAELANIPITYQELEKIRADLKAVPKDKSDEAKAQARIDMANRFREFYSRLKVKAEGAQ